MIHQFIQDKKIKVLLASKTENKYNKTSVTRANFESFHKAFERV